MVKKAFFIPAVLATIGLVSCDQGVNSEPQVKHGKTIQLGHGFSIMELKMEIPLGAYTGLVMSGELRFNGKRIDEADWVVISPSGRYALYEDKKRGGISLFDSRGKEKLQVLEKGTEPAVKEWSEKNRSFIIEYTNDRGKRETSQIEIDALKVLQ